MQQLNARDRLLIHCGHLENAHSFPCISDMLRPYRGLHDSVIADFAAALLEYDGEQGLTAHDATALLALWSFFHQCRVYTSSLGLLTTNKLLGEQDRKLLDSRLDGLEAYCIRRLDGPDPASASSAFASSMLQYPSTQAGAYKFVAQRCISYIREYPDEIEDRSEAAEKLSEIYG